jgi:hypothetical protein
MPSNWRNGPSITITCSPATQPARRQFYRAVGAANFKFVNDPLWKLQQLLL